MGQSAKKFLTYEEQLETLIRRGMIVDDREAALEKLRKTSYYRLSGYWYPFRKMDHKAQLRSDEFFPGTNFDDVVKLYNFDEELRAVIFSSLSVIETSVRALLGHSLGRVDPVAHLDPKFLGPLAKDSQPYERWRAGYKKELNGSREDFVAHHKNKYGGILPVWAAVEILNWGALTRLYHFSPDTVKEEVASECGLSAPQMYSWLKALNLLRNDCAHHKRVFNRVHVIKPKLPLKGLFPDLNAATTQWNRTFGHMTLMNFLMRRLNVGNPHMLGAVLRSYPDVKFVPIGHMGAPMDWESRSALWSS